MMLGAKATIADWWLWNQIPVTIGNLLGGWLLIGLPMYLTYGRRSAADGSLTKIEHDGQVLLRSDDTRLAPSLRDWRGGCSQRPGGGKR